MGKKSFGLLSGIVLAMALVALPVAQADDAERQTYKEAVEPICKANTQANERILKGVRGKVRAGKLKVAGGQFSRAATALRKTHRELKEVPQRPDEQDNLGNGLIKG